MIRYTARDEINQSSIGPTPSGWLQEVDYTYLDNGFLRDINDPITPGPDLFSLRLYYSFPLHGQDPTPQYNGNIAAQQIHLGGSDGVCYTQNFHYDELDRLTRSTYFAHGAPDAHNRYDTDYGYDRRGNLTQLNRHGRYAVDDDNYGFGQIDQLDYAYLPGTNKIKSIADRVAEGAGAGAGFAPHDRGDYRYDDPTGNLTYDPSRDLAIQYNHLNLPHTFTRPDGSGSSYLYTAEGAKLRETKLDENGGPLSQRDYLGPTEYVDGELAVIHHAEGRVVPSETCVDRIHIAGEVTDARYHRANILTTDASVRAPGGELHLEAGRDIFLEPGFKVEVGSRLKAEQLPCLGIEDWQFEYYLKDHLGNNRVLFADVDGDGLIDPATEVLQENHYYAFGLGMEGEWSERVPDAEQRYKFNGMERNEELGLDLAMFRSYDPAVGRWLQVDPKAEAFAWASPYNSMLNNPISNIDPLGDTTRVYNMQGVLVRTINDSHENQEHFLTDRNLKILGGADMSDMDVDGIGTAFRNGSSFFIGANTRDQLQAIVELAESEGLERAYTLSFSATQKELQVNDITGNRSRTSNSIDLPNNISSGNGRDVIVGHVHPTAGARNVRVDPSDAAGVNMPSGSRGLQDYQSLLTGDKSRAYPQMISSVHGYNIYTSARKTPAGSSHPYPMQILSSRGTIINYSGVKVVD